MTEDTHEIRELKWKLKTLAKQNGKQGETIHRLRAELAEVRELNGKIDRGEIRRLERLVIDQLEEIKLLHEKLELKRLHEKLTAPASALDLDDPRHDANVVPCDDTMLIYPGAPQGEPFGPRHPLDMD